MNCPNCNDEYMGPISMSGTEEEITREYYCEECGTYAKLIWMPGKRIKQDLEGIEF